jgi:hypothetical protein
MGKGMRFGQVQDDLALLKSRPVDGPLMRRPEGNIELDDRRDLSTMERV